MDSIPKIKIALTFDDWARVAFVLADVGNRERDGFILAIAAVVERSIGNTAVSGSLEAAAQRVFTDNAGR